MKKIVEMTPFIFEDSNVYYFQLVERSGSQDYHNLFVYYKIKRKFFGHKFEKINKNAKLISTPINITEVKKEIQSILHDHSLILNKKFNNWDGFVGNITDEMKIQLKREFDLKNILGE